MSAIIRRVETRQLKRSAPVTLARRRSFAEWTSSGHFIADREPIDFRQWRYLLPIYEAVPSDPTGMDLVIMKSAQGGASTLALLCTLWLMLRAQCRLAYFLPTMSLALNFSRDRFIKLARDNRDIHQLFGDPGAPTATRSIDEGSAGVRRLLQSIAYFTHIDGKVTTEALPLDALVFDEVQEMMLGDVEKAEERLSASPLHTILRLSTANYAGADIHYFYQQSDQREFHTRCGCAGGLVLADAWDPQQGPLCIGQGNGSTPGVPTEWFYFCPRCHTIIPDPQDGEFIPRNPGARRIGFHFPQMLSPRQTAAGILHKWETRVDTKNFFNRVLGLPYADPNTLPIREAHLHASQNRDLKWGPLPRRDCDGIFMGIDQMGQENYVVIKGRVKGRMRLLHLEIIQDADPWRRCAELMREFHVRIAVVESSPNFNEAHRFAIDHDRRVFLATYQDLADEIVRWGDRFRDPPAVSRSDDGIRTRWTVAIDQFKMMSWSLGRWKDGDVETPDARTLIRAVRTRRGIEDLALCRDVLWLHLQRVALVTESSREDERKPRRVVKKIGIDPHFAFANMLCDVAWVRAHGTSRILLPDDRDERPLPQPMKRGPIMEQIIEAFPEVEECLAPQEFERLTCGDCVNFDSQRAWCTWRRLKVRANMPSCVDWFIPRSDDDDDDY